MADEFILDSVDFITIETIGQPGHRTFHLQAGQGDYLLTLIIEKEQAAGLARELLNLLAEIEEKFNRPTPKEDSRQHDLDLREPILPAFRVAQMGLGYDVEADQVVLILNELLPEDADHEPRVARMNISREQVLLLAEHAQQVVARGRPICPNCGRPIDPEGHLCPKSNGHRKPVEWA
jgi:uncharacterized repeat protein (TIGR03847 family)